MSMKVSKEDREMIRMLYEADPKGWNISALAREYQISRQYVQFILFPERQEKNYQLRKARNKNEAKHKPTGKK